MNNPTINNTAPGAAFTISDFAPKNLVLQFIDPVMPFTSKYTPQTIAAKPSSRPIIEYIN
jgi:hypothetical protein